MKGIKNSLLWNFILKSMQGERDREVLFWDVSVKSRVLIFIQTVAFCWNQGFFECHEWFSFELISAVANCFMIFGEFLVRS